VGNILRRYQIAPAPERSRTTTWKEFIRSHMDVLAGTDFFTVEVLTWPGLITYYILFFIEIGSRRVSLGGITRYPDSCWMEQVGRNATMEGTRYLNRCRYLLHDRATKFCREFRETLAAGGVKCLALPARSPNLNSYAELWVRSVKEECLFECIRAEMKKGSPEGYNAETGLREPAQKPRMARKLDLIESTLLARLVGRSRLSIIRRVHAHSPRSVPVSSDRPCRMDE
jgi:hypothetical protein